MNIRSCHPSDLSALTELTIATFGPYYEDHFRPQVGETIFLHQHGHWADDYRVQVPALYDPAAGKHVAIAQADDAAIAGYVAWSIDPARRHGNLGLLAVAQAHRRNHIGAALCRYAFDDMTRKDVEVVSIGTGGTDLFHAPARALYESLGCTPVHVTYYLKQL
ncbi:MAG TPA: GNAT family N-acetyltransferase [Streptosporangiaceae bacterium]|jgi:ribosomal protein S18 acetylase RimI-like enzyme